MKLLKAIHSFIFPICCLLWAPVAAQIKNAPRPFYPVPTEAQLNWQENDLALYLRYEPAGIDDYLKMNPGQWTKVAKECGFDRVVIPVKTPEAFCFWFTGTIIISSNNGRMMRRKDLVRELMNVCTNSGLKTGFYFSFSDSANPVYGKHSRQSVYRKQ